MGFLFRNPFDAGKKIKFNTSSGFSCLVAAKLKTSLSLEVFSLTGFGHDGVCTERAQACTESARKVHRECTELAWSRHGVTQIVHGSCIDGACCVHPCTT